jgi:hypothetical protein
LPLKIEIFLWQLYQDVVLTKEKMRERKWMGSPKYSLCDNIDTAAHLFFCCGVAKVLFVLYYDPNSYSKGKLTSNERSEARRRRLGPKRSVVRS